MLATDFLRAAQNILDNARRTDLLDVQGHTTALLVLYISDLGVPELSAGLSKLADALDSARQ